MPRHELIGLEVEVVKSTNKDEEGIDGKVIDEMKSVLKVESGGEVKTVKKEGRTFRFGLPSDEEVEVRGAILEGRPEDRVKKRFKKW